MAQQHNFLSKIRAIYVGMFLMAMLLIGVSFNWQVVQAERFRAEAEGRSQEFRIPSIRGSIYASDGTTLAYSEPRYDVYVSIPELKFKEYHKIQTRDEFTNKLGPLVDKTGEELRRTLQEMDDKRMRSVKVATAVTLEVKRKIESLTVDVDQKLEESKRRKITGYEIPSTSKRIYPQGQLASQVLGLTKLLEDGRTIGQGGLEAEWQELEPLEGIISGERDAMGNAIGISVEKTISSQRGNSIYTSINPRVQSVVEERLKWAVENYTAKSGSVVVMDPKTGEVLAMANYPTYDPNIREVTDPSAFGNKAISEPYEIGSVGKIFTLAAAIDLGVVNPDSVLLPEGHKGCEKVLDDLAPVCTHDKKPQPPLPIKQAFELSDNVYFLHLAQLMQQQDFYNYLTNFGIGRQSGIDVKGESAGLQLTAAERWNKADQAAYSYGHSYQMNLLQATAAVGAVANYGVLMQPHVVTKVVRADGTEIKMQPRAIKQVLKRDTVLQMDAMMGQIFRNNIFWPERHYYDLKNYPIAMKSGTALIPLKDGSGYSSDINATYAGYDSSDQRTFVMLVRLERPQGSLASMNARVLWLEIFRGIKDILGVPRK